MSITDRQTGWIEEYRFYLFVWIFTKNFSSIFFIKVLEFLSFDTKRDSKEKVVVDGGGGGEG